MCCECPSGNEADLFLQSIPERQKERLRQFIEVESPKIGEYHVWIQDDSTEHVGIVIEIYALNIADNRHQY